MSHLNIPVNQVLQVRLLHEWQQTSQWRMIIRVTGSSSSRVGKHFGVGTHVVVQGEADLLHVAATGNSPRGLSGLLHGWQKQSNQNGDNRDDNQQFNQSESGTLFVGRIGGEGCSGNLRMG